MLIREMENSYSIVRARLHSKSHDYFVFAHGRWDRARRRMFYGATDALLESSEAATSYGQFVSSNNGAKLLACYGFLQALFVQQDAVMILSRAVGLRWHPNNDKRLKEIRDARNRLTGHPALAGEQDRTPRRLSSAIIPAHDITQHGFRGHVYYEDGSEDIKVEVAAFQKDNEERLSQQTQRVEATMDKQEHQFRAKHAARPFSSRFGKNFDYLLQRLHCDLKDEGRLHQAQAHAKMIREIIKTLEKELIEYGFEPEAHSWKIVFTALTCLRPLCRESHRQCPLNISLT